MADAYNFLARKQFWLNFLSFSPQPYICIAWIRCLDFLQVFPYGSVPLKTYLPDGDIDLTVFGGTNVEDTLADDIKSVLEEEEKNTAAEFVVKDVQLIRAEVCMFLIYR